MMARGIAALLVVGALIAGYVWWADVQQDIGAKAERALWVEAVEKQRAEARKQIDAANARVGAAEAEADTLRHAQNLKDVQNAKITSELERKLLAAGRLRDPNATARCGGSSTTSGATGASSPGTSADNTAQDAGLLSADLSGLLRTVTREADAVNLAYIASRADADQLRVLLAACGMPTP